MSQATETTTDTALVVAVDQIVAHLKAGDLEQVQLAISLLHPNEVATLLESLPHELRKTLWSLVPTELTGEVLAYVQEDVRNSIINKMADEEVLAATETMAVADLVDVIETLPEPISITIIQSLDDDRRRRLDETRAYAENSVGRWMSADVISVRDDVTLGVVMRYLRFLKPLPTYTDTLMVTDDHGIYLGRLDLNEAVTEPNETKVSEIFTTDSEWLRADANQQDIATLFEHRGLVSAAVVDDQMQLIGRVTIDNAVTIIRSQSDKTVMARAGLREEEDLFAPVFQSAKRRAVWLGINLLTVFVAAWVIGQFEEALDKIVTLAVLMPIVASMGGIAGSQTLTLTIRGLALGQLSITNLRWLGSKELFVGLLNGFAWALVIALVTFLWFDDMGIATIIAIATMLNLVAAAVSGVLIPFILERMGIDPALSGAVILTTVTDIVGFLSFLGLATLFLI